MGRRALIPAAAAVVLALAGCGGSRTVSPVPNTIEGTVPKPQTVKGDPAAGKQVYAANGCGACHTFKAAGTKAKVGPDLDNLAADAQKANQPLEQYTKTSITDPNAYTVPGFPKGVMPSFSGLDSKKLADLVAFLTQKS